MSEGLTVDNQVPMADTGCRFKGHRIFFEGWPGEQPRLGEFTSKDATKFAEDFAIMAECIIRFRKQYGPRWRDECGVAR